MANQAQHNEKRSKTQHYTRLLVMTALSFMAMYILMYAMVNRADNALHNLNQVYGRSHDQRHGCPRTCPHGQHV